MNYKAKNLPSFVQQNILRLLIILFLHISILQQTKYFDQTMQFDPNKVIFYSRENKKTGEIKALHIYTSMIYSYLSKLHKIYFIVIFAKFHTILHDNIYTIKYEIG